MSQQVAVVIATSQQIYDYLNVSAAQAAATYGNSVTTLASYLTQLSKVAGDLIVRWIGHDYTVSQIQQIRFFGTNDAYFEVPYPVATISTFKSWDSRNPTVAPVNIGAGNLAVVGINPYKIYRSDGLTFEPDLEYYIEIIQVVDPLVYAGWPQGLVQLQLEMIHYMFHSSSSAEGFLELDSDGSSQFRTTHYKDMQRLFQQQCRPYRKFAA